MLRFLISRHNWLKAATGKLFAGLTLSETTLSLYMLSTFPFASKLAQLAPVGSQALISSWLTMLKWQKRVIVVVIPVDE